MASYAKALQAKVAHVPVEPSQSEKEKVVAQPGKNDAVEPELVATVTNMGKHAELHPTMATLDEVLPEGFIRSCTGFFVDTNVQFIKVNQATVKQDTDHLQKHAIMAYFVGKK
jgi:hypothetical protein